MYGFDLTCVCVLAYLSSELFNTGQFDDSSVRCGRSGDVHIFILVLVFPGSFSVSQHRDNFSHTGALQWKAAFVACFSHTGAEQLQK